MVSKIISKGKKLLTEPQSTVLSAASIIMIMIVASRVLGLVRQRALAHFFAPDELSLFFAAFRLPDLVFEVLVFGTFSSAFIPVFTKALGKGRDNAWGIASTVVNLGLLIFTFFAILMSFLAEDLYGVFAPGFSPEERMRVVELARILFAAQGFFVISYVLTGVLESLRRFLVPALAPLFYNLGIILATVLFAQEWGLLAPAVGVFIGAMTHFAIQLPLAYKMGFRFKPRIIFTSDVKKIGRLALPRVIEVSFMQVSKIAELFFATLISTASYTYYMFGNTLQLLPVGLFGTSIAKAALPTLSSQAEEPEKFKRTLLTALYELVFFSLPIATLLIVLRIPIIRLVYGTDIFDWSATVQTGYVLSAFAIGIVFQASAALLARSFYALHDTRTPVIVSIIAIFITLILDYVFIIIMGLPVWGLALAISIGAIFQASTLFLLINGRILKDRLISLFIPLLKIFYASLVSGVFMRFILETFDESAWTKRLSLLSRSEIARNIPFERFVLDTRYTVNLMILCFIVAVVGVSVYIGLLVLLKSPQVYTFFRLVKRIFVKRSITPIPSKETEPVAPTPTDTGV
jgi:putative peptidoglycan lipid II flippase